MHCTPYTHVNCGWIHGFGPESPQQTIMKICPMQLTAQKFTPIRGSSAGINQTLAKPSQVDLLPNLVQVRFSIKATRQAPWPCPRDQRHPKLRNQRLQKLGNHEDEITKKKKKKKAINNRDGEQVKGDNWWQTQTACKRTPMSPRQGNRKPGSKERFSLTKNPKYHETTGIVGLEGSFLVWRRRELRPRWDRRPGSTNTSGERKRRSARNP